MDGTILFDRQAPQPTVVVVAGCERDKGQKNDVE